MSYGRHLWNIAVGSLKRKMVVSPLGESLAKESGAKGGTFGEISRGEIEVVELGKFSIEVFSLGDMSVLNGYGKF